jgi:hypothetical protein
VKIKDERLLCIRQSQKKKRSKSFIEVEMGLVDFSSLEWEK